MRRRAFDGLPENVEILLSTVPNIIIGENQR
jgi:hypothetical protein